MEKKDVNIKIKEVFDCSNGHKVLLFKSMFGTRGNQCECWCLACETSLIVDLNKKEDLNIIYTHKDALSLVNSMCAIKDEFLTSYYENNEDVKKAVDAVNKIYEEKPKTLTKSKTTW